MTTPRAFDYAKVHAAQAQWTANRYKSRFPCSAFQLLKIHENSYAIFVTDAADAGSQRTRYFEHSIRPLTCPIGLVGQLPAHPSEVCPLVEPSTLAASLSVMMTMAELEDALIVKHSALRIRAIAQDRENLAITLWLDPSSQGSDLTALHADLAGFGLRQGSSTITFDTPPSRTAPRSDSISDVTRIIRASARHPAIRSLRHVALDDEHWHSQLGPAAKGEIAPSTVIPHREGARSIFIPSHALEALPDIRNYLLTYENVILEISLADRHTEAVARHSITDNDIATAAERGRLHLLVTQPEERLPLRLLEVVQERSPGSIIGRRASSVYAMAVLRRRMDDFCQRWPNWRNEARPLAAALQPLLGVDQAVAERILLEPVATYHDALGRLVGRDLKALPTYIGEDAWSVVKSGLKGSDDLAFEFLVANTQMAMANVFGAELAVSDKQRFLHLPCSMLGIIHAASGAPMSSAATQTDFDPKQSPSIFINPATPIFDFSQIHPISRLLDLVAPGDAMIAKSILDDLAALPDEAREARIVEMVDILAAFGAKPSDVVIGDGMISQYARIIVQVIGPFMPFLGGFLGAAQLADDVAGWFSTAGKIKALGEDVAQSRRQIELLRRMRPVAWLSQRRGSA
jgi:hypothetical protein